MIVSLEQSDASRIVMTLQYCLETFQETCQCGECGPCQGQADIEQSISVLCAAGALSAAVTPNL